MAGQGVGALDLVGRKVCRNGSVECWPEGRADLAGVLVAVGAHEVVVVLEDRVVGTDQAGARAEPGADDPRAVDMKVGAVDLADLVALAQALATGSAPASPPFAAC